MKIAFLGIKGVPGHHGVEVVVDSLLPHLAALGHELTVYGYDTYTEDMDDYNGARVVTVQGSVRKSLEMITHMWSASIASRKGGFDIIHIHSTDPCLLAWLPKSRYGTVATSHGQAYVRKKWGIFERSMSRLAERWFMKIPSVKTCVSMPLTDYYNKRYHRGVIYIPNGITMRIKPDASQLGKWDIKPGGFIFCSAGRIERTKGLSTLIEAYRMLGTEMPLVIAGGGAATDTAYFEELKGGDTKGIIFTGFLTGDEFFALYAHAAVFVFPSEYEAMSMALLEGLSFGTPTVYSDIPENEAVAAGIGYPFRVSDPADLKEKLRHVLENPAEAHAMGRKAIGRITENHSWEAIARQYHDIYLKMAEGARAGRSK